MAKKADNTFAFFEFLKEFYTQNKSKIRSRYKDLTKKFLDYNDRSKNPNAYLRPPQFEALEIYVFVKEFFDNAQIYDIFDAWYKRTGAFEDHTDYTTVQRRGNVHTQMSLFDFEAVNYQQVFNAMKKNASSYPNYIYALTMGLGKTVLMATCIFYEFLLARKYPQDTRYCHNALVFAPDKTVLQSLKEILTMDKTLVVPPEYCPVLEQNIKFHYLDDTGITLNTLDGSSFNIIISNTQKIIKKRAHKEKTPTQRLLSMNGGIQETLSDDIFGSVLSSVYTEDTIADEGELLSNQRYEKLTRLEQLGIYVDEAHHLFGGDLQKSMTSLRLTINELADALKEKGTSVIACYNYTGTPYVDNGVLPEVVYSYGLKAAINNEYLKDVNIVGYENVKSEAFLRAVIKEFWETYEGQTFEGLLPKLAIFGATVDEVQNEIRPAVETVLAEMGIPLSKILVNVGDTTITKDNDIRAFNDLDVPGSAGANKQFILLCNKGREGWNCRSLFGVALYRSPKSKVFVLQATMRCLRQITDIQQQAVVRLSKENYDILDAELNKNFHVTISDIGTEKKKPTKQTYRVHLVKPKKLILKRISHHYTLEKKPFASPISFGLSTLDLTKYQSRIYQKDSLGDERAAQVEVVDLGENTPYTLYTLTGEIARYLNISCILVDNILHTALDGTDTIVELASKYNEIIYHVLIPQVFNALYSVSCETVVEEREVELLTMPEGKSFYEFSAEPSLVAESTDPQYQRSLRGITVADKSFHTDTYCFDSKPEKECFLQCIFSDRVKEVYFTGMFTSQYNGLAIQYIDPETSAIRSYYPDFITTLDDGTIQIIEVKGDNKIDDLIVRAKQEAAREMATASKMKYTMIPSSQIMTSRIVDSL